MLIKCPGSETQKNNQINDKIELNPMPSLIQLVHKIPHRVLTYICPYNTFYPYTAQVSKQSLKAGNPNTNNTATV
jgi:hypothetical protein